MSSLESRKALELEPARKESDASDDLVHRGFVEQDALEEQSTEEDDEDLQNFLPF